MNPAQTPFIGLQQGCRGPFRSAAASSQSQPSRAMATLTYTQVLKATLEGRTFQRPEWPLRGGSTTSKILSPAQHLPSTEVFLKDHKPMTEHLQGFCPASGSVIIRITPPTHPPGVRSSLSVTCTPQPGSHLVSQHGRNVFVGVSSPRLAPDQQGPLQTLPNKANGKGKVDGSSTHHKHP